MSASLFPDYILRLAHFVDLGHINKGSTVVMKDPLMGCSKISGVPHSVLHWVGWLETHLYTATTPSPDSYLGAISRGSSRLGKAVPEGYPGYSHGTERKRNMSVSAIHVLGFALLRF